MRTIKEQAKPKYGVFIIESMDFAREMDGRMDGFVLSTILHLCDIPHRYFYVRTRMEFEHVIGKFKRSRFGFLHLSCHGNEEGLKLSLEKLPFDDLEILMGTALRERRLFLSACDAGRFELAQHFIPRHNCASVIGSPDKISIDKAAVFWSSFYHLMWERDRDRMPQTELIPMLEMVTQTFQIRLIYFSIIRKEHPKSIDHLREIKFDQGVIASDTIKETPFPNRFRK